MGFFDDLADLGGDIVDAAGDGLEAIGGAAVAVAETVYETAETVVDTATGALTDPFGSIGSLFGGVIDFGYGLGETFVDVADTAVTAFEDTVVAAGTAIVDTTTWVVDTAAAATDFGLSALDDTIFDGVDYLTGGIVDLDYDDGNFSAQVGIEGVAEVGVSFGESGVNAEIDTAIASAEIGYNDETGFGTSVSAGVDWGPLPYVEGHVEVTPEGDISVGGEAQATIPTPYGIVSAEGAASVDVNSDGSWSANVEGEGSLTTAGGTFSAGGHVGYAEDAEGNTHFEAGGEVGYESLDGSFSVGAGVEYEQDVVDGVETTSVDANAHVEVSGVKAEAEVAYDRIEDTEGNVIEQTTVGGSITTEIGGETYGVGGEIQNTSATLADGTEFSNTEVSGEIIGIDADMLLELGEQQLLSNLPDAPGGDSFDNAADAVSALAGEGDLSDVLNTMSSTRAGDGTNAPNVIEAVSDYVEQGNFDDFTSDVVSSELTEASADQLWEDLP